MLYIAYMILNIARMLTVVAMCTIYTMMWSLSVIEALRLVTIEIKSRSQTPSSSSSTIRVSNTIDHVRTVLMTIYHMDHGKVLQQVDMKYARQSPSSHISWDKAYQSLESVFFLIQYTLCSV